MLTRKGAISQKLSVFVKDQCTKISAEATLDVQEVGTAITSRGLSPACPHGMQSL
jgi:hypothetical protein